MYILWYIQSFHPIVKTVGFQLYSYNMYYNLLNMFLFLMSCNFLMRRTKEGVWSLPRVCCIVWKISERRRKRRGSEESGKSLAVYGDSRISVFGGRHRPPPERKVRKGWDGGIYVELISWCFCGAPCRIRTYDHAVMSRELCHWANGACYGAGKNPCAFSLCCFLYVFLF